MSPRTYPVNPAYNDARWDLKLNPLLDALKSDLSGAYDALVNIPRSSLATDVQTDIATGAASPAREAQLQAQITALAAVVSGIGGSSGGTGATVGSDDWTGSNGASWNSGKWTTTQNGSGATAAQIQTNKGRLSTNATAYALGDSAWYSGIGAASDQQVTVDIVVSRTNLDVYVGISSADGVMLQPGPQVGYFLEIVNQTAYLSKSVSNGVPSDPHVAGPLSFPMTAGSTYRVTLKRVGSVISAYLYTGTTLPATPNFTYTDPSPLGPGYVILGITNDTTAATGYCDFDNLAITTPTSGGGGGSSGGGVLDFNTTKPTGPNASRTYDLAFSDDFTGTDVNTAKWYKNRSGGGPNWYVDGAFNPGGEQACFAASQVTVANSLCTFTVANNTTGYQTQYAYMSGTISTQPGFNAWGNSSYIEAVYKKYAGAHYWPAFWGVTLDVYPPEIDIDESYNGTSASQFNYHYQAGGQSGPANYGPTNLWGSFHNQACERYGGLMIPYIDGVPYTAQQVSVTDTHGYFIIFNGSIQNGGAAPLGKIMDIDWVRCFNIS